MSFSEAGRNDMYSCKGCAILRGGEKCHISQGKKQHGFRELKLSSDRAGRCVRLTFTPAFYVSVFSVAFVIHLYCHV